MLLSHPSPRGRLEARALLCALGSLLLASYLLPGSGAGEGVRVCVAIGVLGANATLVGAMGLACVRAIPGDGAVKRRVLGWAKSGSGGA